MIGGRHNFFVTGVSSSCGGNGVVVVAAFVVALASVGGGLLNRSIKLFLLDCPSVVLRVRNLGGSSTSLLGIFPIPILIRVLFSNVVTSTIPKSKLEAT
jgi:hypothetical protein